MESHLDLGIVAGGAAEHDHDVRAEVSLAGRPIPSDPDPRDELRDTQVVRFAGLHIVSCGGEGGWSDMV